MKTVTTVKALHAEISRVKEQDLSIGFVPTMGALHKGHLELMKTARTNNNIVVVSIFVNPTQFNNPNDLRNYPRTIDQDIAKCESVGVDIVFAPTVEEVYPIPDNRVFDFGNLDKVMEGEHRPGHFNGVAQVVSKLFSMVKPTRSYFGQKDFQQLAVIRALVKDYSIDVDIVACPTFREDDGLAMSSRNALLSAEQRANVPIISKTLFAARNNLAQKSVKEVIDWVTTEINANNELDVEYFEISNANTLQPITKWSDADEVVGCIAVQVGNVRLIDNVIFK
ncbi:MAG: pantoate--beta-alanine ligase [Bacteroidales bacterium]|nr:pantoate--beta-alanine ligase [Bacteroidales bacterium]MDD4385442.1 pantoate--beta-alanine ligase [Bacteroidales bacterium]